jgi:hypothetical protein
MRSATLVAGAVPADPPAQFATDTRTLERLSHRLRTSVTEDQGPRLALSEALFEDLEAVLDKDAAPDPDDIRELSRRLHHVLGQLLRLAAPTPALATTAQDLVREPCPHDPRLALGYVRRLALVVLDLADRMAGAEMTSPSGDGPYRP